MSTATTTSVRAKLVTVPSDCPDHNVTMPLGCEAHGYEHLCGQACWNCGRQYFFADPFNTEHPWYSLAEQQAMQANTPAREHLSENCWCQPVTESYGKE